MLHDLAQFLAEQAMKPGRVITISRANVTGPPGAKIAEYIELQMTNGRGQNSRMIMGTHAKNGRLREDRDWIRFLTKIADHLDDQESE